MPVTINGNGSITGLSVGGLPDGSVDADTLASNAVTTAKIANSAVTSDKATGSAKGVTMLQQWRMTSDVNVSSGDGNTDLTSNWEEVDTNGYGSLGSSLSQSSGIFTFPSTGIYLINAITNCESKWPESATTDIWGIYLRINVTTNNSSYSYASIAQSNLPQPATWLTSMNCSHIFDVTDTSTHKFKLSVESEAVTTTFDGDSSVTETGFTVIRLGDT